MQSNSNTQLRLKQQEVTLVISVDAWRELIEVAREKGWKSEHSPACYWGDIGLNVTKPDARRLARVFEAMGDYLAHDQIQHRPADVAELVDNLSELVMFCRTGGFRIC